jgi:DNA-binding LytR/AlgR family response regulator
LLQNNLETEIPQTTYQNSKDLFRLFVKNDEYVYARPNDIIMIESCDHLVKVYVAFSDKIKKTVRHDTLKNLLLLLPQNQFVRIGRFCAVNLHRLSGGNYNKQIFEFDFKVSIKLAHPVPHHVFNSIGK